MSDAGGRCEGVRRVGLAAVLFAFAILALSRSAWADEVRLKNGSVFRGVITAEDAESVTIKCDGAAITLARSTIDTVVGGKLGNDPVKPPGNDVVPVRRDPRPPERPKLDPVPSRPDPEVEKNPVEAQPIPHRPPPVAVPIRPAADSSTPDMSAPDDHHRVTWNEAVAHFGWPGLTIGMFCVILVFVELIEFALYVLVTWGVARMMYTPECSLPSAFKIAGFQYLTLFVLLGGLGGIAAVTPSSTVNPSGSGVVVLACIGLVGLAFCIVGNLAVTMRCLKLNLFRAFLFGIVQGFLGSIARGVVFGVFGAVIGAMHH